MKVFKFILNIPKKIILFFLGAYQKYFSPDHSFWANRFYPYGYCKFHPTCSEYCRQSIEKKGAIKGVFSGIWRILRCNPWSEGGVDEPNENKIF